MVIYGNGKARGIKWWRCATMVCCGADGYGYLEVVMVRDNGVW